MNVAPQLKKITFAKFPPAPPINVDHSFRHYGHFVSGQHCAGGRGGKFYLGLGCSKIRQKRSSVSLLLKPIVGTVPLKGNLTPSRETRVSSREARIASRENVIASRGTRFPSREKRVLSRETRK